MANRIKYNKLRKDIKKGLGRNCIKQNKKPFKLSF